MYVKNLSLTDFRNYQLESFNFSQGVNVLYGDNAQGKTNVVEALFYLCTGYSPRAKRDKQFIRYGQQKSEIKAVAATRYGESEVSAKFFTEGNKVVTVNGTEIKRSGELLGNVNAVYFNPSELRLVTDAPEDRRRFIDISVSQIKRSYYYALQNYQKILAQRNNLLKSKDEFAITQTLSIWDRQLAPVASKILADRGEFIDRLAPKAKEIHFYLTDGAEELEVAYDSAFKGSERDIEPFFLDILHDNFQRELELGYTCIGPHRDDLKLTLNGKEVKVFGSQGQMRTTALSLKLAEAEIYRERYGENPILVLDDAFSELDRKRKKKLFEKTKGIQTLITCTDLEDSVFSGVDYKAFHIQGGRIVEEE